MVEANRAYDLGDAARLRSILHASENSPEAVLDSDLAAMVASPLGQLKTMVDEAAARGKDLIADNIRRLKRDIIAARNRRDAILWSP